MLPLWLHAPPFFPPNAPNPHQARLSYLIFSRLLHSKHFFRFLFTSPGGIVRSGSPFFSSSNLKRCDISPSRHVIQLLFIGEPLDDGADPDSIFSQISEFSVFGSFGSFIT